MHWLLFRRSRRSLIVSSLTWRWARFFHAADNSNICSRQMSLCMNTSMTMVQLRTYLDEIVSQLRVQFLLPSQAQRWLTVSPQEKMLSSSTSFSNTSTIHFAGNTIGELAVSFSSFLVNAHLYFRRRYRWSCHRQQPATRQECQYNNGQQQNW